ncbi:hypothetical protein [Streptacidiphilus anmyonensis]|uniref:hypothetical protein n=1 Tax=Streptacidiphilus anmyonensis TaxID=405782 RepID=UPI0005A91393|nr:hypothetical protein [Streptacidiphilus anmyonensis]
MRPPGEAVASGAVAGEGVSEDRGAGRAVAAEGVAEASRLLPPEALEQLRARALDPDPAPVDWATAAARAAFEAAHAAQAVSHGLADLRDRWRQAEWLLEQARRERAALEAAVPDAARQLEQALLDRDAQQDALNRLSDDAEQARRECAEATRRRQAAEEGTADLVAACEAARSAAAEAEHRLEDERAGLEQELGLLRAHETLLEQLAAEREQCRQAAAAAGRQAETESDLLEADRTALHRETLALEQVRAEAALERERLLRLRLSQAADGVWERARRQGRRFGEDPCPEADNAAALWTALHLALLRLPEEERRAEARALAEVARDLGLDPGSSEPAQPSEPWESWEPSEPSSEDPAATDVMPAVPSLPLAEAVPALRLSVTTPSWDRLDSGAQQEVRSLLRDVAGVKGDHRHLVTGILDGPRAGGPLAAGESRDSGGSGNSGDSGDAEGLLLRGAVRVQETLLLLWLDPLLGRHLGTAAREWRPWQADGLRNEAVQQLARLGAALASRAPGEPGWRTVAERLHELDELLAVHHRSPAAVDSWWGRHRAAALPELRDVWRQAGCHAVTDAGELQALLTGGDTAGEYFERNDLSPRPKPVLQWIESVPVVQQRDGSVVRKGRLVCGVVDD